MSEPPIQMTFAQQRDDLPKRRMEVSTSNLTENCCILCVEGFCRGKLPYLLACSRITAFDLYLTRFLQVGFELSDGKNQK